MRIWACTSPAGGWAGHRDPLPPGGAAARRREGACSARLVGPGALEGRPGDELARGRLLGPGQWDCSRRGDGQVARGASPALGSDAVRPCCLIGSRHTGQVLALTDRALMGHTISRGCQAPKLIQGVVLKTQSESAAVMVCSNVYRGHR